MSEHYSLRIRGHTIDFHIYVDNPQSEAKVLGLEPYFARLPDQHLRVLYPIFVMKVKPGGELGGGFWPPADVAADFTNTAQGANTDIPFEDIKRYAMRAGTGIVGLTEDRWQRPQDRLPFSVLHEVGHCVDHTLHLTPHGDARNDIVRRRAFAGMETNRCGHGDLLTRRIVEVYARYICSPSRVSHVPVESETPGQTNARLVEALWSLDAFLTVPASWRPT